MCVIIAAVTFPGYKAGSPVGLGGGSLCMQHTWKDSAGGEGQHFSSVVQ